MKQIPLPNAATRSVVLWSIALGFVAYDVFSAATIAAADSYAYAKVDQHCLPGIDRTASIPQDIAAIVQQLPPFSPVQQVVAQTGPRVYCQLPPKSVPTPNGSRWGDPFVLPIEGTTQVLVVTVNELGAVLKTEVWDAQPDDRQRIQQQISNQISYWSQPASEQPEFSALPYDRRPIDLTPPQQQQPTQQSEACR